MSVPKKMLPNRSALTLVATVLILCAAGCFQEDAESLRSEPPALVIMLSIDTLRADRLDLYGYGRETAPNLTAIAKDAAVFRTALSQASQTLVSHKSMFTGKTPMRLMREQTGADLERLGAIEEPYDFLVSTLAGVQGHMAKDLSEAGYRSAAFVDGGWMRKGMGFEGGFDSFDDTGGGLAGILPKAIDWIDREQSGFLFLQTYDVHCPYKSREPYNSRFCRNHRRHMPMGEACPKSHLHQVELSDADRAAIRDHYDGGIASADAYVGELIDHLRKSGLYDEALIVITSDHGEGLGDHAQFGHGGLYLEQLLVPLIIKFPKSWELPTGMIEENVELVDLLPTLFEACGLPLPEDLDGRSLMPTILGEQKGRRFLVAQTTFREWTTEGTVTNLTKRVVVEPGKWFLIHDYAAGTVETYSLGDDPACLNDLAGEQPQEVIDLLSSLESRDLGETGAAFRAPESREFSAEMKAQLEKLGYTGG
ncbi:MAG: arylsulfatase A-like enzyme [Planctomycetota bacterium]|jgi:arylsulfatase A-like enzyme